MKPAQTLLITDLRSIDDHRLLGVIGGGEAEGGTPEAGEPNGLWARTKHAIEHFDGINYGVGAATGLAIGPLVAHAAEKSWRLGKWAVGTAARIRARRL